MVNVYHTKYDTEDTDYYCKSWVHKYIFYFIQNFVTQELGCRSDS